MRRLAVTVRITAIFALSVAAGVAAYLGLGRHTEPRSEAVPGATAPPVTSDAYDAAPPMARLPTAGWRARPQPVAREPNAADGTTTQPDIPPEGDQLSRNNVRGLVERVFKGKLADRELAPYDYEGLVDAVMRLRSALRILRSAEKSQASAAALDEQRQAVLSALTDIEAITGVRASELGDVLAPDDGLTGAENDGAESIAPNRSP